MIFIQNVVVSRGWLLPHPYEDHEYFKREMSHFPLPCLHYKVYSKNTVNTRKYFFYTFVTIFLPQKKGSS